MADPSLLRFRLVIEAALAQLEARREEVNDLNVFPVADGDTGDNMALTLRAVLTELDNLSTQGDIDEIGRDPASLHRSTQALVLLGPDGRRQAEELAAIRPAIGGTSAQLVETVQGWADQGLDELIVPGFTLGTGSQAAEALDQLVTEVAPSFR